MPCKISILIFALLRICELSVHFYTGIAIFTLLRKTVFRSVKIAMLWLFFGCILESSEIFVHQNFKTTFSIVLKSGITSEDTTSEQNRVHEGTAALQPRHTDARATPHMTPTPNYPDSFAGWSDDPVCTFTRCQPFAFGVLRVKMPEPSLNVQMIGCRARVGTHMPVGRPCWSQIIRFHHRVTEHFPF